MKRFLSAFYLICSLAMIFVLNFRPSDKYLFSDLIITARDLEDILDTHSVSEKIYPERLSFNGVPLVFDSLKDRWFYPSSETAPSSGILVSTENGEEVRIRFTEDPIPGKTSRMVAYTDSEYRIFELAVTTLPIIKIECATTDLTRDPEPIRFTLIDNRYDPKNPVTVSGGTMHMRGWSSIKFPKKGFRITLTEDGSGTDVKENKTALLGLRNDGDWLLYPAYNDQERIRNVFSSNLWFDSCGDANIFHIQNGMEYRYTELFLNDEYWGLYALGYPIDAYQVGIRPDNQGHYDEFLFKQQAWGPHTEDNPEYDGLILQMDMYETDSNNGVMIMKMYFDQLENGASGGLYHNDPVNAVDVWLYMKLIQAHDTVRMQGRMKNMMFTIRKTESGRKILFTPWDMDIAWGNIWDPDEYPVINYTVPYGLDPDDNSLEMSVNPVSVMLQQNDPEVRELIVSRYRELREDRWSDETIAAMIAEFEKDIYDSGAYVRDVERWPDSSQQDPELKLSLFAQYVQERFISMDAYIEDLETL